MDLHVLVPVIDASGRVDELILGEVEPADIDRTCVRVQAYDQKAADTCRWNVHRRALEPLQPPGQAQI